jgi:hypothetical protein
MSLLKRIGQYILKHYPVIGIIVIWAILLFTNYPNGNASLVGWDSLQTELDPGLAIKRAFYSGWQEYQSFGLPAGMGHAADLVRSVILYPFSYIIPANLLRYMFHMTMVLVGALGMLKLLELSGIKREKKAFAFLGALFYMLNYNIIQMMFLPYESFTIFAGMLPWQIWAFLRLLAKPHIQLRDWMIFILVFVLAISQAQALQLFVVLMLTLFLITIGLAIRNDPLKIFKRSAAGAIVIIIINSFWLLPQAYFLKTSSGVVQSAKINQLSTQDVFYRNKDKGNLKDFLSYTGFFSDGVDRNQQPLFAGWKEHRNAPPIMVLIYTLSAISILGVAVRSKYRLPFVLLYVLVVISLLNNTVPIDSINALIRKNSLINQIFRSPFTKFSILYALVASYFFAHGVLFLSGLLSKVRLHKKHLLLAKYTLLALFMTGTILQALPAFQGLYISPEVRVEIPKSYLEMMQYFKSVDKNKRIGLLPEYTHWGWLFNEWGYDGSGFIWYGIEQPIISRNFDMWSTKSEGYFWEMKNALEGEDIEAVERVLDKYGVDYLIFDHSVSPVVASVKTIQDTRVEDLIQTSTSIKPEKKWGFITLYKVNHEKKTDDFVWMGKNLPNIGPAIDVTNNDTAFRDYGDYQTAPEKQYDMYYPFLDLTTQTEAEKPNWTMKELEKEWQFSAELPKGITLPDQTGETLYVLYNKGAVENVKVPYRISFKQDQVIIRFPKILVDSFKMTEGSLRYCVNRKEPIPPVKAGGALRIEANEGNFVCSDYENLYLDQTYGYLLKIQNKNHEGQRLFFYALDKTKDQPYIEDRLSKNTEYYILGDKYKEGIGYSFTFQANSHKTIPSVNYIEGFEVYIIPYDIMKGMGIRMTGTIKKHAPKKDFDATKSNYHKYTVTLDPQTSQDTTLVLNQAYHEGWRAYTIQNSKFKIQNYLNQTFPTVFGEEIKSHVMVNNWANGWNLENGKWKMENGKSSTIVLVYLPQYLQYLGLTLIPLMFSCIFAIYKLKAK